MFMEAALMVQAFGPGKRRLNVLFFAVDDLRYQLGTAGPVKSALSSTLRLFLCKLERTLYPNYSNVRNLLLTASHSDPVMRAQAVRLKKVLAAARW